MSFSRKTGNGINFVPAYQVPGTPYLTGSTAGPESITKKEFIFPRVTRDITLVNLNGTLSNVLSAAFSAEGLDGTPATGQKNYFAVPGNGRPVTLEVRCRSIFLSTAAPSDWTMCAGLSPVTSSQMPALTGSNGFSGVGGLAT